MNTAYETLQSPPSGLCACRMNGKYVHIAAISPRSVTLRLPEEETPSGALSLHLYQPEKGRYAAHTLADYETGEAQHHQGAVLLRLCFDDSACARDIRRMLNDYARCLQTKSELGASAWAQQICNYPAEEDFSFADDLHQQRRLWFEHLPPLPVPSAECQLAAELNCPELWKLYLNTPIRFFPDAYARSRALPSGYLSRHRSCRLYIGSSFCRHLFPDEETLLAIAEKAEAEGLFLTLSTAELRAGGETQADRTIALAQELHAELEINDWGMLRRAAGRAKLILGPRLNRRRKDPRMPYKPGLETPLLAENSLNSPGWIEFLKSLGIERLEYESCSLPTTVPEKIPCSLHLPFYQTNTSLFCPLRALCLHGDRGYQTDADCCTQLCEANVLLYPKHLNMIGRFNSLLALAPQPEADALSRYDRWVLNY